MPEPFRKISIEQFARMLELFSWNRKIDAVHIHHTWRPTHAQWKGLESVRGMWRYHTQTNGWSDIAQHLTIGRDGDIWTGRNWDVAPASASGYNGNANAGPFMIEINGDFDTGKDTLAGAQLDAVAQVVALLLRRHKLDTRAIRFHRDMTNQKSCPGTGVNPKWFAEQVKNAKIDGIRAAADGPFERDLIQSWVLTMAGSRSIVRDEGELAEDRETYAESRGDDEARGSRLTPEQLTTLIPYVVNMREGKFASTELFHTDQSTVDAIFTRLDARAAAAQPNAPLRVVLWAHGGLKTEHGGLEIAHKHVWWWEKNGVYPIYFVWETGLFQTIGDTVSRAWDRLRGKRAIDFAAPTDFLIEKTVRALGGAHVWGGMKFAATESSKPGNAADYVAQHLGALVTKHGGKVQLHALGHSAGSKFHAHFVPAAIGHGAKFETMQFLAPAVRVDDFTKHLLPVLGPNKGVDKAHIFTMYKQYELADNVARVYRKSLLYLISRALEPDHNAKLLGLEESLRGNPTLVTACGLNGQTADCTVVFSKTAGSTQADEHGEFDDDPETMDSVGRLVVGTNVAHPYPPPAPEKRGLSELVVVLPPEVEEFLAASANMASFAPMVSAPPPSPPPYAASSAASAPSTPSASGARGQRRALCVGINDYPTAPLRGCVADARTWAAQLQAIGFSEVRMLLDAQASRRAIVSELESMIAASRPGDVLVFQAAGHGTTVPDLDGDEKERPTDQAFCPHDFASGALLIDDDVANLFNRIPEGVLLTCFFDFCHSGTATRFAVGTSNARGGADQRARFIEADSRLIEEHRRFRRTNAPLGESRSANRGPDFMREVVFSACRPDELAWESSGQGDYTRNVAPLLARWSTVTNQQFQDLLTSGFTPAGRQHPILDCAPDARNHPLLGGSASSSSSVGRNAGGGNAVAQLLRDVAAIVEGQGA
ncbi:MAG TPA: caspase family protein [Thermoanaerobaculia bacterium]|nr:caspase family protein [Thermoanaerobaculia bacterium]